MYVDCKQLNPETKELCPSWEPGRKYEVGEKVAYKDVQYECRIEHVPYSAIWTPEELLYFWSRI